MLKSYVTALLLTLMTAAPAAAQCKSSQVTIPCTGPNSNTGIYKCDEEALAQACSPGQKAGSFLPVSSHCNLANTDPSGKRFCVYDVIHPVCLDCSPLLRWCHL
ncbi:hypothetical protein CDEST_08655 [Colletotrichum destructivum]|uniref:Secreted protein n=1 Tax=Colletotrichum destructivum TaxID=34406 RepID=A0AAX4IKH1_9PEZI|nr:hypothetical protein CDEST_08655 [Colletotrichum destructivum]